MTTHVPRSGTPELILFDADVIIALFDAEDPLFDLVGEEFGAEGGWVGAVKGEVAGISNRPGGAKLRTATGSWLGDPIEIPMFGPERAEVEDIRDLLSSFDDPAWAHLGESESIYVAERDTAAFVVGDASAAAFAQKRGIPVLRTFHLICALVRRAALSCEDACRNWQIMMSAGTKLPARNDPVEFCGPGCPLHS